MLLGVVSVLAVATVVLGLPVWLLVRQRAPAPPDARSGKAPAETGEWVFPNPAQMTALAPHRSYPNARTQSLQPHLVEASQTQYLR